jgi:hypothetical protein
VALVPLVYLLVAAAAVERSRVAVAEAAREAGRAFATSESEAQAEIRVGAAVRLALASQGLADDARLRFVAAGAPCSAPTVRPSLAPGAVFTVCVTRRIGVPAVPRVLAGRSITVAGRFLVHVDDYRAAR